MGSGGRRFGQGPAHHRDGVQPPKATKPPAPPEGLPEAERRAWDELRAQIAKARTYNATRYTAFRLAVKALAAVDAAPPDTPLATLKSALEVASKLVGKFGLDPVSVLQAERGPAPKTKAEREIEEYLR